MLDRRRATLDMLRVRGGLTVNELATELRTTRAAASNHIARLVADDLVTAAGLKPSGRRPSVVYVLTAKADRLFRQEYDTFAVELLDELARSGKGQIARVLHGVGERWIAKDAPEVRKLQGEPRLEQAIKLIAARGFMPTLRKTGPRGHALQNHNCPIVRICRAHHGAAAMVKHWIEALVGGRIERSRCIFEGGHACEYAIAGKPSASAGKRTST